MLPHYLAALIRRRGRKKYAPTELTAVALCINKQQK